MILVAVLLKLGRSAVVELLLAVSNTDPNVRNPMGATPRGSMHPS